MGAEGDSIEADFHARTSRATPVVFADADEWFERQLAAVRIAPLPNPAAGISFGSGQDESTAVFSKPSRRKSTAASVSGNSSDSSQHSVVTDPETLKSLMELMRVCHSLLPGGVPKFWTH